MKRILKQQGYLTIIVALLLFTIAFTSLAVSFKYANKALSVSSSYSSMQSYYLAKSGLERAKYDMAVNHVKCENITGATNETNATFPNAAGQFTVTSSKLSAATTLSANITLSATTIPLTSVSGFANNGSIVIESEVINYTGMSGNSLTGAIRGIGGSAAVAHSSGAPAVQNVCVLTSVGGVPSLSSPISKRTIQEILIGSAFSGGESGSSQITISGSGLLNAAVVIGGNVNLSGNATIINSSVTNTSANFSGATILSGGSVLLSGGADTQVSDGAGSLTVASSKAGVNSDIQQYVTQVNTANIWNTFFSQSKATLQASAVQTYNGSTIVGATGQTIWTGDLTLRGGTIGTASSPVILIINGNLDTYAGTTIAGLVYVTGAVDFHGNTFINGLFAMEGPFTSNGALTVNYNPSILTLSGSINPGTNITYSPYSSSSQEQFV